MADPAPIKVCSHRRSGTHFLMASIYENFEVGDQTGAIKVAGQCWHENGKEIASIPWCNLFGAHGPLSAACKKNIPYKRLLYVVRHPYDCLFSLWRFWHQKDEKGNDIDLIDFMSTERICRWRDHVTSYAGVRTIRYEDLCERFDVVMSMIGEKYGLTPKHSEIRRPEGLVGWSPRDGRHDYWKSADAAVIAQFRHVLVNTYPLLEHGYKFHE